jgi:hypothetical protein
MTQDAAQRTVAAGSPTEYSVEVYKDIEVCWRPELEGGGRSFGQDYLPVVRHLFGKVGRVFEFCAGPGFIGFSLLAHGLCDSLAVADVNPEAVAALRETVRRNGLADRVSVYLSDGLANIPDEERWDLVVSNPPHFAVQRREQPSVITDDLGWKLHRDFYARVSRFLNPGGAVLIQENFEGSVPADFIPMMASNELEHVRSLTYSGHGHPNFYFLWAVKASKDIVLHDSPVPVLLNLAEEAPAVQVPAGRLLKFELHNSSPRTVQPSHFENIAQATDYYGPEWGPVAPGERLALPCLVLRAGDYVIRDRLAGDVMCRIHASSGGFTHR